MLGSSLELLYSFLALAVYVDSVSDTSNPVLFYLDETLREELCESNPWYVILIGILALTVLLLTIIVIVLLCKHGKKYGYEMIP